MQIAVRTRKIVTGAVLLLSLITGAWGQDDPHSRRQPAIATVTFSWALWSANPPLYTIQMDSTGAATYISTPRSVQWTGVPYTVEFLASRSVRRSVFDLVEKLNLLNLPHAEARRYSAGKESVKTLSFREGGLHNQITYQTPDNRRIRRLTSLFEVISKTIETGRRLAALRQSSPEKLGAVLLRMERISRPGPLPGLPALVPVLEDIAADRSLGNGVRECAHTILNRVS